MKRLILPAILALSTSVIFAQQPAAPAPDAAATPAPHHHAPNPEKQTARLTKELNLTPDQATKIQPLIADHQQKLAAVAADTSLTDDARQSQLKAIRKEFEKSLRTVLTPDQLTQMKTLHKEHEGAGATEPLTPPSA
jgi:periplasmic protein CpxP/Spy